MFNLKSEECFSFYWLFFFFALGAEASEVWSIHDGEKLPAGPLVPPHTHQSAVPLPTDPLGRPGCCYIPHVHGWAC